MKVEKGKVVTKVRVKVVFLNEQKNKYFLGVI